MLAYSAPCPPVADSVPLVEVFRTNVAAAWQAAAVVRALHNRFPALTATLDLDDCDRVLRVESCHGAGPALWQQVLGVVRALGVEIDVLPD